MKANFDSYFLPKTFRLLGTFYLILLGMYLCTCVPVCLMYLTLFGGWGPRYPASTIQILFRYLGRLGLPDVHVPRLHLRRALMPSEVEMGRRVCVDTIFRCE